MPNWKTETWGTLGEEGSGMLTDDSSLELQLFSVFCEEIETSEMKSRLTEYLSLKKKLENLRYKPINLNSFRFTVYVLVPRP